MFGWNKKRLATSAGYRAARTFIVVWIGQILWFWYQGSGVTDRRITGLLDSFQSQWDVAAGFAFVCALGAAGWRFLLDPAPVPSLNDPTDQP